MGNSNNYFFFYTLASLVGTRLKAKKLKQLYSVAAHVPLTGLKIVMKVVVDPWSF